MGDDVGTGIGDGHTRTLFALTFGALVVLFVGSNLFVVHRIRTLEAAVTDITENGTLSIEHLSAARAALPRILLALNGMFEEAAAGRIPNVAALVDPGHQFDSEARMYLALPAYPRERELWFAVARDIARLDKLIGDALEQIRQHDLPAARATQRVVEQFAELQTVQDVMRVIALSASQVHARAASIRRVERASVDVMAALDALSVALALGIAISTSRAINSYESRSRWGSRSRRLVPSTATRGGSVASTIQRWSARPSWISSRRAWPTTSSTR